MINSPLIEDVFRVAEDASRRFMHPSSSGNISVHLDEILLSETTLHGSDWVSLGVSLRKLCGQHLLISTSGSNLSHVREKPHDALGIVEFDESGQAYRKVWGFEGYSRQPTSEIQTHARIHDARGPGAVIHNHPLATNALMLAGHITDDFEANRAVWQGTTEGIAYLPGGIRVIPWCMPCSPEIGEKTAAAFSDGADAVLWDRHGLVAYGPTLEKAYGTVQTIEHAMVTLQMALAASPHVENVKWLSISQLESLVERFGLKPRENIFELLRLRGECSNPDR